MRRSKKIIGILFVLFALLASSLLFAQYQKALKLDPDLGRSYAGMGVIENNRGRHQEADRYFQQAMAHVGRMSEREKYRTRGAYYLVVTRDADKAIEELSALVKQFPADNAALANLGVAYQLKRDFPKALEFGRRAIQIYPKNVPQRSNLGLFAYIATSPRLLRWGCSRCTRGTSTRRSGSSRPRSS